MKDLQVFRAILNLLKQDMLEIVLYLQDYFLNIYMVK